MPSLQLIVDVATKPPGSPGVSREFPFADAGLLVTLKLANPLGVTQYAWEILDQPEGAAAVLPDPTAAQPTFTMASLISGTYLCRCTVNGGTNFGDIGVAILTANLGIRKPAAGETRQFSTLKGWKIALNWALDQIDQGGAGNFNRVGPGLLRTIPPDGHVVVSGGFTLEGGCTLEHGSIALLGSGS